jgi:GTPase SAR1 family protein
MNNFQIQQFKHKYFNTHNSVLHEIILSFIGDVHMVVVGDNNVGKTSLCITFSTGQFPSLFTPMECNRVPHEKDITLGSETIHVKCTDTEGNVSKICIGLLDCSSKCQRLR